MTITDLSPSLARRLKDCIVGSFDRNDLEELLEYELERRMQIDDIATENDTYPAVVRKVIRKGEREGWLLKFSQAAHEQRPDKEDLRTLHQELQQLANPPDGDPLPAEAGNGNVDYYIRLFNDQSAIVNRDKLRKA